jgi:DNA primase
VRFNNDHLEAIRDRVSVSDVLGPFVSWDRRKSQPGKGDYWACCPFHQEKTPSFHADDRKGRYYCFGCGAAGDIFSFLTDHQGLTFPEAVERLAEQAGVTLPQERPEDRQALQKQKGLREALDEAARCFQDNLALPQARFVREYALSRGLNEALCKAYGLGYAPDQRDGLKRALLEKGFSEQCLVEAGLLGQPEDGRASYDRFRGRLMIPIHDRRGHVVAFGGRALQEGQEPKYLNSPETPVFSKKRQVFNYHRARDAAHRKDRLIVVEGYMDVLALHKTGFPETVAALGTAFSAEQVALLWKLNAKPILCFDGDQAGLRAAWRLSELVLPLLKPGMTLQFCFMPEGLDPDDLVHRDGPEAFEKYLSAAKSLSDVLLDKEIRAQTVATPDGRASIAHRLQALATTIADDNLRYYYKTHFRRSLSAYFWALDNPHKAKKTTLTPASSAQEKPALVHDDEKILLGLTLLIPSLYEHYAEIMGTLVWQGEGHDTLLKALERLSLREKDETSFSALISIYEGLDEPLKKVFLSLWADRKEDQQKLMLLMDIKASPDQDKNHEVHMQMAKLSHFEVIRHWLQHRMPFLKKCEVPDDFLTAYFDLCLLRLQLRDTERERDSLMIDTDDEAGDDDGLMALHEDIQHTQVRIEHLQHRLDSWLTQLYPDRNVA